MPFDGFLERGKALEGVWARGESTRLTKALRISLGYESGDQSVSVEPAQSRTSEEKVDMGTMLSAFFTRGR